MSSAGEPERSRSRRRRFVDRLLVPVALVPLALLAGLLPRMLLAFAVLDPVLAVAVWRMLHHHQRE